MSSAIRSPMGKAFELREPPTEDKVMQVNLGSQDHPKPIFISESLSLMEKEELIILVVYRRLRMELRRHART